MIEHLMTLQHNVPIIYIMGHSINKVNFTKEVRYRKHYYGAF